MSYAKTTELFNNAQLVLLETVGSDEAIVSIHKLSLSGYGSQQNTGTVTITLPIPTSIMIIFISRCTGCRPTAR